jgi:hypothetical protein
MRLTTHEWHLHPPRPRRPRIVKKCVVRLGSTFACYTRLRSVVSVHEVSRYKRVLAIVAGILVARHLPAQQAKGSGTCFGLKEASAKNRKWLISDFPIGRHN